jgi:serine/threonine-protein kinase
LYIISQFTIFALTATSYISVRTKKTFSLGSSAKARSILYVVGSLFALFILFDNVILPWYVNHGDKLAVPDVLRLTTEDAEKLLDSAGLEPVATETRPDPQAPVGTVLAQNPESGALVKQGRRVYLSISGGELLVSVPPLRGLSARDARFTLERNGLQLGAINYATSDAYFKNTIMDQTIRPGTRVTKGSKIGIILSRGRLVGQSLVPDLIGKTVTEAEKLLTREGLRVGNITYQASFELLPNTVIEQFPRAGDSVPEGQAIDLFVVSLDRPKDESRFPEN